MDQYQKRRYEQLSDQLRLAKKSLFKEQFKKEIVEIKIARLKEEIRNTTASLEYMEKNVKVD
jgi:hypothetical protein